MSESRAVWQERHGEPAEVLQVRDLVLQAPAEDQLQVEVHAAPILPMDNLRVRGHYPLTRTLPGIPGSVGIGLVTDGPADLVGSWVAVPMRAGSWATRCNVPIEGSLVLHTVPDAVQASLLRVNGLTAQALLSGLERDDWVLYNAANGGVGHYVTAIARRMGVKTAAVVRSEASAAGVSADVAVVDGPKLAARLADAGMGPAHRALDGVGGDATGRLGSALSDGGRILHYGAMSREAPRVRVPDCIFRGVLLQGFWLYKLDGLRGQAETARLLNRLIALDLPARQVATIGLDDVVHGLAASGRVVITPNVGAS